MKSILFLISLTCLVFAADQHDLVQQLYEYETLLLRFEDEQLTSAKRAEMEKIKNDLFLIKHELRQTDQFHPPKKQMNVTAASSDFEFITGYIYDGTTNRDRLVANIRNTSFIYATWVKVHFNFYKNNILIGDKLTFTDFESYEDYGVLPFHHSFVDTYIDKMDYDDIIVEFEYSVDEAGQGTPLCEELLQLLEVNVNPSNLVEWSGLVNNSAGYSVEFPKIYANFIKDFNLIDIDYANLDTECQGNRTIIIDYVVDSPVEAQQIRLHNCTQNDVNLGGWFLGNKNNPYSYVIPSNTIIDAGTKHTFDNNDLNFTIGTTNEIIYLFNSSRTQIDTWTKEESDYRLEPFTTCEFNSYLDLPKSYDAISYRLNYSISSLTGDGNIAPNRPRFTLREY